MMLKGKNPATDDHDTDINLITIQWYEKKKVSEMGLLKIKRYLKFNNQCSVKILFGYWFEQVNHRDIL